MKQKFTLTIILALMGMIFPLRPPIWSAGTPVDQVRVTVDKVLAILQDPGLSSDEKRQARRDQLRQAIFPTFDFAEMAKRSLGSHWRRRSPAEQKEFVSLFTDLLQTSYVGTIESYSGDKVAYLREVQDKNYAEVGTNIISAKGQEFTINYRLHLQDGEWKVYDVVIENISIVNNYRSQFNRVINRSSYEELLRVLKEKQQG